MQKVKFTIVGSFVNETITREIDNRDLDCLAIPGGCFKIEFYDLDKGLMRNKEEFYLGSILTKADVNAIYGFHSSAHRNIENLTKKDETPFLGAAGNLVIIKKTAKVIDPFQLAGYPPNALLAYKTKLTLVKKEIQKSF